MFLLSEQERAVRTFCVTPPAGVQHPVLRAALAVLALVGLETIPLALVWLAMQAELYGWGLARVLQPASHPSSVRPMA